MGNLVARAGFTNCNKALFQSHSLGFPLDPIEFPVCYDLKLCSTRRKEGGADLMMSRRRCATYSDCVVGEKSFASLQSTCAACGFGSLGSRPAWETYRGDPETPPDSALKSSREERCKLFRVELSCCMRTLLWCKGAGLMRRGGRKYELLRDAGTLGLKRHVATKGLGKEIR